MNPDVNQAPVSEEQTPVEEVTETVPKPGEKTDSALLLASLHEEREKRRLLEAELASFKQVPSDTYGEVYSDEGKLLDTKISRLEAVIAASQREKELLGIQSTYPVLKDKDAEFEQFRNDNPGMKIETAAKAFLVENDLIATARPRKGLESATGGGRAPVSQGMTPEEIDNLRVNNYNEYARRIRNGTLK